MGKRRIRIDIEDAEGATYNLNLTGNITREKVLKAFEFLDLMNIEETPDSPQMGSFDPLISTLGVKMKVNIVNNMIMTPLFPLQAWGEDTKKSYFQKPC